MYDTTLRDGVQAIEINYTLEDKMTIAHALDDFNIDYIEGGFPFSNEKDHLFFDQCKKETFKHATIASFGSTRRPNIKASADPGILTLLQTETPAITIVGKSWTQHVTKVIQTTLEENLAMIYDSVLFLKEEGREVIFDAEHFFDGFKDDAEYATKVLLTATQAGADYVVVCDTNGGTLPQDVQSIMQQLPHKELCAIGGHFHNDCETAVANSLISVEEGATQLQGTINGWGERCGNANLCSLVANIALKQNQSIASSEKLAGLTLLSRFVCEKANIIPDKRQPFVGEAAFSHKAGQHADVILKSEHLMEHINAEEVGNKRHIILSELAGKSTIIEKLKPYGSFDKSSDEVARLFDTLKQKELQGYEYEAAEASFDLLMRKELNIYRPLVTLKNYHLESFKTGATSSNTVGRAFLTVNSREVMGAAVGTGPVEVLDATLRNALESEYPFLESIFLIDYRVRVLNPESAAASMVRVFITSTDHVNFWDTVGVHSNILEASWQAILDSFDYYYNNYIVSP